MTRRSTNRFPLSIAPLAVAALLLGACGGLDESAEVEWLEEGEDVVLPYEAITSVNHTVVKRQSIGNCWLYATASWAESMYVSSTGSQINLSESYWTYMHWYEQIVNGEVEKDEISTGGSWDTSVYLIGRYGVMEEKDFVPEEATSEMSGRQSSALNAINAALKSGALKDASARRNRTLVRQEMDKAWGLSADVTKQLTKVFKADMSRHLAQRTSSGSYAASTTGTKIKRATSVKAAYSMGPGKRMSKKSLATAITDWKEVGFWASSYGNGRRDFEKRIQRALHDKQPLIMSWFVDFNALDGQGRFAAPPSSPGRQGGHMTVLHDYEIENVPGYGTLKAGVDETRKAALDAALANEAKITFLRTKNSWGLSRPDRAFAVPGYHDLYMKYLYGPVKRCAEGSTTNCFDYTPLQDVVFPPGY